MPKALWELFATTTVISTESPAVTSVDEALKDTEVEDEAELPWQPPQPVVAPVFPPLLASEVEGSKGARNSRASGR
jgi:hypothetical protein